MMTTTTRPATSSATYTRLRSGEWGLRVPAARAQAGHKIWTIKKDGSGKDETIGRVVWQGSDVALCTIARQSRSGGYRDRECPYADQGAGHSCPQWADSCWYYDEQV